jgi:hypothetical protein
MDHIRKYRVWFLFSLGLSILQVLESTYDRPLTMRDLVGGFFDWLIIFYVWLGLYKLCCHIYGWLDSLLKQAGK